MTTHVHSRTRSLEPALGRAFLGALFAMFWLTVLISLVLGGALLLLARSLSLASF
ncbi:MAG TPA: hypothetical protein VM688_07710 [Nocardioidaceae bacterium]|nr:hypothetical protein [Nocardioidaceae bacterium]